MPFYLYKFDYPGPVKADGYVGEYPTLDAAMNAADSAALLTVIICEADTLPEAGGPFNGVAVRTPQGVWQEAT